MGLDINSMKGDTDNILSHWQEEVIIKRKNISYNDMGEAQIQWEVVLQKGSQTIPCDIQPLRGDLRLQKQGIEITCSHQIFFPSYADVQPDDALYIGENRYLTISQVAVQPGHIFALCRSVEK